MTSSLRLALLRSDIFSHEYALEDGGFTTLFSLALTIFCQSESRTISLMSIILHGTSESSALYPITDDFSIDASIILLLLRTCTTGFDDGYIRALSIFKVL